jgi:hypothetical protein
MMGLAAKDIGYIGKAEPLRHKYSGLMLEGEKAQVLRSIAIDKNGRSLHQASVFATLQECSAMTKLDVADQFTILTYVGTDPEAGDSATPLLATAEPALRAYKGKVDANEFAFAMALLALAKGQKLIIQSNFKAANKEFQACHQLLKPLPETNKPARAVLLQAWSYAGLCCIRSGR